MNPIETPERKTTLEVLRGNIADTRQGVEAEFAKGLNPWLACFGSRIFQVETYLYSRSIEGNMSEDKLTKARQKLAVLKTRFFDLKEQYDEATPSDEVKEELFNGLSVLD